MKKASIFFAELLTMGIIFCGCAPKSSSSPEASSSAPYTLFQLQPGLTGDSKLFLGNIVATVGGHLAIYNTSGELLKDYPEVAANWIYTVPDHHMIAVANANKEVRIIQLSDDLSIEKNFVVYSGQSLMIDPTLLFTEEGWYLTFTEIEGTVNNADPDAPNGFYSTRCLKSADLQNWIQLPDIVCGQNNLEDGDMIQWEDTLYYFFEKEVYDKGPSSLQVISSTDYGNTWGNQHELISADADNELAAVFPEKEDWKIYYSSDKQHPGESYEGASCYLASFNPSLTEKYDDVLIDLQTDGGVLLYDISIEPKETLFLYVKNYVTENRLTLEAVPAA